MNFPEFARVIYSENPLVEVVCQVRFPRVLAIDERLPVQFQESLGKAYPVVETKEVAQLSVGIGELQSPPQRTHYVFKAKSDDVSITLCSEFVAIRTNDYKRWESFKSHIEAALEALQQSYGVGPFTRVGLRYIDVISREKLGLFDKRWADLIRGSALGLFAEPEVPIASVEEQQSAVILALDSGGKVAIRSGIAKKAGATNELQFVFDCDFFEESPVEGNRNAIEVCDRFNRQAGNAFRWIIGDELHDALGPTKPN